MPASSKFPRAKLYQTRITAFTVPIAPLVPSTRRIYQAHEGTRTCPIRIDCEVPEGLFDCVICFDTLTRPVALACVHVYCYSCIHRALLVKRECPYCRATVTSRPMRDGLLEEELAIAIADGLVSAPGAVDEAAAYDWDVFAFQDA